MLIDYNNELENYPAFLEYSLFPGLAIRNCLCGYYFVQLRIAQPATGPILTEPWERV
jgi:hypothetical protein